MQALDRKFIKTYNLSAAQAAFKYTTLVRHKGTVIAFAMDDRQRIYYSVLDLQREGVKSGLDSQYWDEKPQELRFPGELAQVGYSVAGVQKMPNLRKNGAIVSPTETLDDKEKDLFLSTTSRFTADEPFQVLSDDKHIYVFRQAIDRNHPHNIKLNATISLVDRTLLCDRFVLVSGQLKPKLETRYQRSRNKDLPSDRKDSSGYEDLEQKSFYEPTQELAFIGNLVAGRFSIVLIPTGLPDVQRWQIFAYNEATQRMDSFNIARSNDGLFNTRGTRYYTSPDPQYQNAVFERDPAGICPFTNKPLIEIISQSGFAESALQLNGVDTFAAIPHTSNLDFQANPDFSLEVWLKAEPETGLNDEQCIVDTFVNNFGLINEVPFSLYYLADSGRILVRRTDDTNTFVMTSSVSINDAKFHHLALVKQDSNLVLYVDGQAVATQTDNLLPITQAGLSMYLGCTRSKQNFFKGQIDEVRLWKAARSQPQLQAELHHRLIGNETNLVGYWRFDEGSGTDVFDQTNSANHGYLFPSNSPAIGDVWVKSEAPVGEHPGVRRSSFAIKDREITSGCASLLYYQQEQAETGYNPTEKKPIKRNARVMFAVPTVAQTQPGATKHEIAVLDFAVARDGGLVQILDRVSLTTIDRERVGDRTISDILDRISQLEQAEQSFTSSLREKTIQLQALQQRMAAFPICDVAFTSSFTNDGIHLFNGSKTATSSAPTNIRDITASQWRGLPAEWATGIDAIVNWGVSDPRECYIFKGKECLRYDRVNYQPIPQNGTPQLIGEVFDNLPDGWADGIDAAIRYDAYNAYFFKGDRCLRFQGWVELPGNQREFTRTAAAREINRNNPPLISEVFPGVPSNLTDVDEVYQTDLQNDTILYFFKGDRYFRWSKNLGRNNAPVYKGYTSLSQDGLRPLVEFYQTVRSSLQTNKSQLEDETAESRYNLKQTQQALVVERQFLQTAIADFSLEMPLLHTDPAGLTLSGAVLGFAWSNQPPLLFESVNGRVSLYFRGQNEQFFAAYYDVLGQRSTYTLAAKTETGISSLVTLVARSTTQSSVIQVMDGETPDTCTVNIINQETGITETWKQLPRQVQAFADVLNGTAQPVYLGKLLKPLSGAIATLDLDRAASSKLAVGATLLIGQSQARVSVQSFNQILKDSAPILRGAVLEFDGQDDYIQLADAVTLGLTDRDFTVEAWVCASDLANPTGNDDRPILGTDAPREPNQGLHLTLRNGKPRLGFFQTDLPGRKPLVADTWYHIVWRYTKATQEQAVFVNGERDDSKTGQSAFLGTATVNIGRWNGDRYFKGYIAEVRVWNEARSIEQLRSTMNQRVAAEAKLAGYWRFEAQGNQVIARDYSQYGRHGIVHGNPQLVALDAQATRIQTAPIALATQIDTGTSVYWLPYDYAANAQTNKATHSLEAGSLSFRVNSANAVGKIVTVDGKQIAQQSTPASANAWFTDSQNSALLFSETAPALSAPPETVSQFAFGDDMTLEAWVNHGAFPVGTAKILHYNSGNAETSYALGLFRNAAIDRDLNPVNSYGVFVGVGDRWVKTTALNSVQQWQHIAAVFQQSYALKFNGAEDVVNCGNDITLDIPEDLTIEAFIRLDSLTEPQAILTKGKIDDGTEQDCAYSLYVDRDGQLVFAFEDKNHGNHFWYPASSKLRIAPGYAYRVAVTRTYNTEVKVTDDRQTNVKTWFDLRFYASREGAAVEEASSDPYYGSFGTNNQPLELGQGVARVGNSSDTTKPCHLNGEISEVRIWNRSLPAAEVCKPLKGSEKGLVSWWQFEENQGTRAYDSKSNNHGAIANATWTKSHDVEASRLTVYINGESVLTAAWTLDQPTYGQPQFSLGGQVGNQNRSEVKFQGQLDEIRIWNIARTEEQIQDNLFRRVNGDWEHLLAYYTCDAGTVLKDSSGRGLDLPLDVSAKYFVLSTAPISSETAQVRNALAQVKTPFHTTLDTAPAVQEYGDIQLDSNGSSIGVMKRCYAYIKDGRWHLIAGYKVSDLELEWIGQAQYEPQLVGFIEGAPPVPSENLTIRDPNLGQTYEDVSVVELTEADRVTYAYAASKENGLDTSLKFKAGIGGKSKSESGFGFITSVEEVEVSVGTQFSIDISRGWLNEQRVGFAKGTTRLSRLGTQGSWEAPNSVHYPAMGRRYTLNNVGLALVKSKTADIFALRLKHRESEKRVTIALSMRPNPDIPEDWNIITFPINPRYTKQGTLDGRIGLSADEKDYPGATTDYSTDLSYFKPIEAYTLKHRIEREQQQLAADSLSYSTAPIGAFENQDEIRKRLPAATQMNLYNTYVWTADGGLFAETQNTMNFKQEVIGGTYSVAGMAGMFAEANIAIAKAAVSFELEAMMGGHLNLVSQRSQDSETGFEVNVALQVERDITIKTPEQAEAAGKRSNELYDVDGNPVKCPGKVDGYRFMTFYLQPDVEHFKDFQNKVVDRAWLEQSSEPNAIALRHAIANQSGTPWRVLHRVTYVSRVLPEIGTSRPIAKTEETLRAANIESNWELIKTLDPFVKAKSSNYPELKQAVEQAIDLYLPELAPAKADIVRYVSYYYQVFPT